MIDFPKIDNQKDHTLSPPKPLLSVAAGRGEGGALGGGEGLKSPGAKTLKLKATSGYAYSSDNDVTIRMPWENVSKVAFKDLAGFVKTNAGFVAAKEILAVAEKNEETPGVLTARVSAAVNGELYVGEKS